MKINKIKINSYGKLKNKEINLENNLNIIYGKNESGKSTLLKFILNIFYGASRNKKGRDISDFEKYKPWDSEEYSGKLTYELDDKSKYEIYREFNKKNPKIFNEKGEDISKEFNIDKNKGSEFFFEQTQISEDMFLATSIAMQQEVKIEKGSQNILIQRISNLVDTGEDNISYKKAVEKINKIQLEKVGTDRSREKPINIIQKNIEKNQQKINELKKYENIEYEIEEEKNIIKINLEKNELKNNLLKEIKILKEKNNLENEKIKIKEKILEENKNKINEIKNKIEKIDEKYLEEKNNKNNIDKNSEKNKLNKKLIIFFILLILINILFIIFIPKGYIFLLTVPTFLIFSIFFKNKLNKKIKILENDENKYLEKINLEKNNLKNEEKIYENNLEKIINEINNLKLENNQKNNFEENKLINKYEKNIEKYEINNLLKTENINEKIYLLENQINNSKLEINKLELKKGNIEPELEKLASLEEELFSLNEQYENLKKTNESIELVKTLLSKAYEKMKNNVSPVFTGKLSENISKITKGKYSNLYFSDEQGLTVELENGNYIPAERLSVGTIDQLYLSLRLAMLDEISTEKVPIILDEAFAYYDNERLKNILIYLTSEFSDRQIIIFTCTKREKEILEELNIQFNNIEL